MIKLSEKASAITASPTLAISAKAKSMKKAGINVIGFGAGEPDFDTPSEIKETAIKSIENGFTKYTPASGTIELKEAVTEKLQRDNKLSYETSQIIIGCGAKHILYNIFQVICNPGDEVILLTPYWVSYTEMIKLAEAKPVLVETREDDGFAPQTQKIAAAVTNRTKAIIINSPNNPTGAVYTETALREIAALVEGKEIFIIADEVYENLIYGSNKHFSIATHSEKTKAQTIVVNAVSKTYAMTGWRIGYAAGPKEIISTMGKLQSHSTSNPTSISQKAAVSALCGSQEKVRQMVVEFAKRRDYIKERCRQLPGVSLAEPQGAFYIFPNISCTFGRKLKGKPISNSLEFSEQLLEELKVAVVPGSAFGAEGHIRMTFANSLKEIEEGFNRIEKFLELLK